MEGTKDSKVGQTVHDIRSLNAASFEGDEYARTTALLEARALCARLETPWDRIVRTVWEDPLNTAAIHFGIEFGIFRILVENDPQHLTSGQIAQSMGADAALTQRMMRSLAATKAITQIAKDLYAPNEFSKALTTPEGHGAMSFYFGVRLPTVARVTEYFQGKEKRNPNGLEDCPWKYTSDSEHTWFDWMQTNPQRLAEFGLMMKGFAASRPAWTDVYPASEIFDGAEEDGTILVDVGGGVGDSIQHFLAKNPQSAGRLVLQDQPTVVDRAVASKQAVQRMPHDFFSPQPIKGARAYFLRMVLHDWSDDKARAILLQTRRAMRLGYSKVLINELVVSSMDPAPFTTAVDLLMMTFMGGKERSEQEWTELLQSAGLRLVKRWESLASQQSILEAEADPAWRE